jgi:serine/threonine protein phosphatase PrpC
MIEVHGHGLTDTGRQRKHNEDTYAIDEDLGLYMVCDGLGGHAAGEVASDLCQREVRRVLEENRRVLENYREDDSFFNRAKVSGAVEIAVDAASRAIRQTAEKDPSKQGMCTTVALMLVLGENAIIGHVGDSRLYLVRDGAVYRLTEDHTIVNEQLRRGLITPEEAAQSPKTGMVTRTVGFFDAAQTETLHTELRPGDRFVLCSDGLSDHFEGGELAHFCAAEEAPEKIPEKLATYANDCGGHDNITVVYVAVEGELSPEATDPTRKLEALRQVPMLKHLNYQELMKVLNITELEHYEAGQTILQEGESGDSMFISIEGTVDVTKQGRPLAALPPGSFFGEMALLVRAERSATIRARQAATLMKLERPQFFRLVKAEHELAAKLLWAFAQVLNARLRETTRELSGPEQGAESDAPAIGSPLDRDA